MIFVDSDAFIAIYSKKDLHHKKAVKISKNLKKDKTPLITSWDVVDETATKLSFFLLKKTSLQFLKTLMNGKIIVIFPDEKISQEAIKIFKKQTSKKVSLTDCTNMAIAQAKGIKAFFSFDKHYMKNGFELLDQTS